MAGTRNTNTRKASEGKTNARKARKKEFNNVIEDFEVSHVRTFEGRNGNYAYFTLNLGFISIYSMLCMCNRDGEYYISFASDVGSDGEYYKRGYIENNALTDAIIEEVTNQM